MNWRGLKSRLRNLIPWLKTSKRPGSGDHEAVFSDIYRKKTWGGESADFCSGFGSNPDRARPYIDMIQSFVAEHQIKSVLDLGCGDFQTGGAIDWQGAAYIGADVVPDLIERNQRLYGADKIRFMPVDLSSDDLPEAQLCLIKQVLMHLSDETILQLLPKLRGYQYVLISDSWWANRAAGANVDIPTGGGRETGFYLELPPFNQKVKVLLEYEIPTEKGVWFMRSVQLIF